MQQNHNLTLCRESLAAHICKMFLDPMIEMKNDVHCDMYVSLIVVLATTAVVAVLGQEGPVLVEVMLLKQ